MSIETVYDYIGSNVGHIAIPAGVLSAGYDTGSGGIQWTQAEWATLPNAIHIDQDAGASDFTSDILDVESGAATPAECARWYSAALAKYNAVARVGQRHPSIYCSQNNVTPVVNALIAGGVTSGPGLWVANWNLSDPQAVADVTNAAGPFPIIGVQFRNVVSYDVSVFSSQWLNTRAAKVAPTPTPPLPPTPAPNYQYGVCPAGGKHDTTDSYDYVLTDQHGVQSNWRWCVKCTSLTHAA